MAGQVPDLYAEETGDIGQQVFFRFGIAVLPVGDGAAHQAEDLVAAGPGHTFLFSENSAFVRIK